MDILPTYYLFNKNTNINIEDIAHDNHYDFSKPHRHRYFELFFFRTGGGSQQIDFNRYELKEKGIYMICPGQIHLMERSSEANGVLIQFTNEFIMNKTIPFDLFYKMPFLDNAILFEECMVLVEGLKKEIIKKKTEFQKEIISDYLRIILLKLFGSIEDEIIYDKTLLNFITLLEQNYKDNSQVNFYLDKMNISNKKLNLITKKHLGSTALNVIHDRVLLEVKRLIVCDEDMTLKEISFALNFDSQASFSNFIKKKTSFSPKELQQQLLIKNI